MTNYSKKHPLALITGASHGIGKAIAKKLAQNQYDLILTCSSSIAELNNFADDLRDRYSVACKAIQSDVSSFEDVSRIFEGLSSLDILVNNAGTSHIGLLQDMTIDEWNHIIGTNLNGAFYTSKLAVPLMLQQHSGKIINISSVWGNVGASMEVAYSASKGGLNSFTKALAKELAPSGISVNAIACGMIDTRMNSCFSKEDIASIEDEIPAGRMGTPEEVALTVLKLIESPSYLTGQIITIDGGWT